MLNLQFFNGEVAKLQEKDKNGERILRNEVMELAEKVDEAFQLGDLDGEVAFALQTELFFLWPDK